mgnify:CR=1 FL=1
MVEYYDSRKKALIKITKLPKYSRAKKKQYYKNRSNEIANKQRELMGDIVFTRGMASKDPDKAPIDERENIIRAQAELSTLENQLIGITKAIQALTVVMTPGADTAASSAAEKIYLDEVSQTESITLGDILAADRDAIGASVFDAAVINHTRKERLKLLAQDPAYEGIINQKGVLNKRRIRIVTGKDITTINELYSYFANQPKEFLELYPYIRTSYDIPETIEAEPSDAPRTRRVAVGEPVG